MKPDDTVTMLFKHHLWANLLLLESCAGLTDEQMAAIAPGAVGSIHDTWKHLVTSEQTYYSRISTGKRFARSEVEPAWTIEELAESLRTTGNGLINCAAGVQAGDIVQIDWDGTPRDVPKTIILTQIINHATEHREQIKTILTQIGIEPPDLQGWGYFEEVYSAD